MKKTHLGIVFVSLLIIVLASIVLFIRFHLTDKNKVNVSADNNNYTYKLLPENVATDVDSGIEYVDNMIIVFLNRGRLQKIETML